MRHEKLINSTEGLSTIGTTRNGSDAEIEPHLWSIYPLKHLETLTQAQFAPPAVHLNDGRVFFNFETADASGSGSSLYVALFPFGKSAAIDHNEFARRNPIQSQGDFGDDGFRCRFNCIGMHRTGEKWVPACFRIRRHDELRKWNIRFCGIGKGPAGCFCRIGRFRRRGRGFSRGRGLCGRRD